MWPAIGETLGLKAGTAAVQSLVSLYEREADWQVLVQKYSLVPCSLRAFVGDSFYYADALFATGAEQPPPPALVSTIKLRQAGFAECIDTEDMFAHWFRKLIMMNRLPAPG
jgi:hypothetical protein